MKSQLRFLVVTGLTVALGAASLLAQEERKETLGDKLKKLFVHPAPTPTPRKRHKSVSSSTTALPTVTAISSESSSPQEGATPLPSASEATVPPSPETQSKGETQYFEAVRPINPGPRSRQGELPKTIRASQTPTENLTAIPEGAPEETPESRPMPSLPSTVESTTSPIENRSDSERAEIVDTTTNPQEVRKIVDLGLELAAKNLPYKYASADPADGGMDCSGFIDYVLTRCGIKDVPRDAREQYVWVRKAGNFQAVLAQRDDTFELDSLKPGDLLFWASNFGVSREPEITQTMIYIGRDKATNQRLMVGASENGTFEGEKKSGVGIFDFKLGSSEPKTGDEPTSIFVGYGHIPNIGQ